MKKAIVLILTAIISWIGATTWDTALKVSAMEERHTALKDDISAIRNAIERIERQIFLPAK